MSETVSNCFQINKSPLNTSTSKQLYSFPKESRFKNISKSQSTSQFYDIPDMKSNRKAFIGFGQKYDFTHGQAKTPAPSQYSIKSSFELDGKRGKSFGIGREAMSQFGILGKVKEGGAQPGPGAYEKGSMLSPIKYTMRQKTGNIFATSNKVPGPGSYSVLPTISPSGKFPVSKYKNYGTTQFNPISSKRFQKDFRDDVPGSQYNVIDSINEKGKYIVSRHKNSPSRTFGTGIRDTLGVGNSKNIPGPGAYRLPSDFGYYESKAKQ